MSDLNLPIDHILYGVQNLEEGIEQVHELTGIKPVIGGSHPGLGTRNALLGLGNNSYLEIIAPDPEQKVDWSWMNIDKLQSPKLFRWAAFSHNLYTLKHTAMSGGINLGDIRDGGRKTPDGLLLSWLLTDPYMVLKDGIIPFFIDWGDAGNPTPTLPIGCELISFTAYHPDHESVSSSLDKLGIQMTVEKHSEPKLVAKISTPNGIVELS